MKNTCQHMNDTEKARNRVLEKPDNLFQRKRIVRNIYTALFLTLFLWHPCVSQETADNRWSFSAGLGMANVPSYLGDNDYQVILFPNFRVAHSDKIFASLLEGVGYNVVKVNSWRFGPIIKYHASRYGNGSVSSKIEADKNKDLINIGDVVFTVEPGLFFQYSNRSVNTKLEIRQGIGGHNGLIGELKSEYRSIIQLFGWSVYYAIGPQIKIADSDFNNAFFGIDQRQALETDLGIYDPKFGVLSYGLNGSLVVPLRRKLSLIAFAAYNRLGNVAAESDLIIKYGSVNQGAFGLIFNYTF
jgi:outer membrane scaffolding protein for murein synthesis (MipA/OmpV family)